MLLLNPRARIDRLVRQFQNRFARVAAAFVNMCLREFGVWSIILYCGVPGMDIPANMCVSELLPAQICAQPLPVVVSFEALQVKSVARRGLRDWANMEGVLDMLHDYVFESAGTFSMLSSQAGQGASLHEPLDEWRDRDSIYPLSLHASDKACPRD